MEDDEFAELLRSLRGDSNSNPEPHPGTSWEDVRAEALRLGQTVGDLLRSAWERPESQAGIRRLREAVDWIAADAEHATSGTPEARQAREQLRRVRDELLAATEQATRELRPDMVALLRDANGRLRRLGGLPEE